MVKSGDATTGEEDRMVKSGEPSLDFAGQYEQVHELYLGEIFRVEVEYGNEPPFNDRLVGSKVRNQEVVSYQVHKLPDHPMVFRSEEILIDAPQSINDEPTTSG